MTRPSHALPPPMFDALLDLETASRIAADMRQPGGLMHTDPAEYLRHECRVGALRDDLAALILDAIA